MARGTENLFGAEIPVEDGHLIDTLCRHIEGINADEVFNTLSHLPSNLSSIKDRGERIKYAERQDVPCPNFDKDEKIRIKVLIRKHSKDAKSNKKLKNEEVITILFKSIPRIDNADMVDLLCIREANLWCIKSDKDRLDMAIRHGLEECPNYDYEYGLKRLREHVRNVRHKQKRVMDELDSLEDSEFVMFGDVVAEEFERIKLCGDFEQINHLFGVNHSEDKDQTDEDIISGIPIGLVSVLAGSPGVGKTRFAAALCGHVAGKKKDGGLGVGVAYFQNEMKPGQFKALTGTVINDDSHFACTTASTFATQEHDIRKAAVKFRERGTHLGLVIIDSINMLRECRSSTGMKLIIPKLSVIAKEIGCHIMFIGHLNKAGQIKGTNDLEYLVDQAFLAKPMAGQGQFSISCPNKNRAGKAGISVALNHTPNGVVIVKVGKGHRVVRGRNWGGNRDGGLDGLDALGGRGNRPIDTLARATRRGQRGDDRGVQNNTMTEDHQPRTPQQQAEV